MKQEMCEPVGITPKPALPPHINTSWLQSYGLNYAEFQVKFAIAVLSDETSWTYEKKKKLTDDFKHRLMVELWDRYKRM
uniref:Uncharacterized protein n=1 Tax=viral metagenome TaxID=1070528 RepID=A0A6C0CUH8_9ZZZZ